MATEVIKTIKPSGGDYISLNAFEAGEQRDLTAVDEIAIAECYSMSDTTSVAINGWTTDSTRFIKITTPLTERHDGKWNTGKYRIEINGTDGIANYEDYVTIEGLQIEITASSVNNLEGLVILGGNINNKTTVDKTIIRGVISGTSTLCSGIRAQDGDAIIDITNSVIYGFNTNLNYGIRCQGNIHNVFNSVVAGCTWGINGESAVTITNCAVFNNNDDVVGTFTLTYSAGDDVDFATGTGNVQWLSGSIDWNTNFTNYATGDFSVKDSAANIYNAGVDLSGSGVTDDIIGTSRPQSAVYDIGAFELAAPPSVTGGGPRGLFGIGQMGLR